MSSTFIHIRRLYVKLCESDRICKRKRLKKSRVGVILPVREDVGSRLVDGDPEFAEGVDLLQPAQTTLLWTLHQT